MTGAVFAIMAAGIAGMLQGVGSGVQAGSGSFAVGGAGAYSNGSTAGNWILPAAAAIAGQYQVKVDVTGGAFTSGSATGTYFDCSSGPSWVRTGVGTVTFTVTFREKVTGIVRKVSAGITLQIT